MTAPEAAFAAIDPACVETTQETGSPSESALASPCPGTVFGHSLAPWSAMLDVLFKAVFYVLTGLALVAASVWYARSLYDTITGRSEVVIAPFEIVGDGGEAAKGRGVALALMLQARLQEIERDVNSAQKELMAGAPHAHAPAPSRVDPAPDGGAMEGNAPVLAAASLPSLLTQGVGLRTALLQPTDIKMSVGGVEVGGLVAWVQRRLASRRTLLFTLYEKKTASQLSGSLQPLDLADDAMRVDVPLDEGDASVTLDRVVERAAYEIVRRRLAQDPGNRVEILSGAEFQSLVEVLREAARLNRRVVLGRGALPEFQELLPKVSKLATDVPEWFQLNFLAASVAESAKDPKAAVQFYEQVAKVVKKDGSQAALLRTVETKIADLRKQIAEIEKPGPSAAAVTPEDARARETIESHVRAATLYLNELLQQSLKPPPVEIQKDPNAPRLAYWDGAKIVAPPAVQYLPDISYRVAAWQHIFKITGSGVTDADDGPATAIVYSYNDVLTMLVHQHENGQNEKTSDWVLAPGAGEWWEGKDLARVKGRTPYLSFKLLQAARKGGSKQNQQVGHMRDYDSSSPREMRYINCGIFNRAFYEAAIRVGTLRAGDIWIAALRKLKTMRRVDFPRFAKQIYDQSGDDKDAIAKALAEAGLDPARATAAAQ